MTGININSGLELRLGYCRAFDVTDSVSEIRVWCNGPILRTSWRTESSHTNVYYTATICAMVGGFSPMRTLEVPPEKISSREWFIRVAMEEALKCKPGAQPFCCVRHQLRGLDKLSCVGLSPEFL